MPQNQFQSFSFNTDALTTKSADYALTSNDQTIIATTPSASFTLTVPTAAANAGKIFRVRVTYDDQTKTVTLARSGSDNFSLNGTTSTSLVMFTIGEEYLIQSDGTATWFVIDHLTINAPITFTTTGSWVSNATFNGKWWRVGDHAKVLINIAVTGTPTSANLTATLPFSWVIDTAKLVNYVGNEFLGSGTTSANSLIYPISVVYSDTTKVLLRATADSTRKLVPVTQAVPDTYVNGDWVSFEFSVPITGWKA